MTKGEAGCIRSVSKKALRNWKRKKSPSATKRGRMVAQTTGVKLGRRSLKFVDYGIMAATFIDLSTSKAFRVISTEESRDLAALYAPLEVDKVQQQIQVYKIMPDSVMFRVQEVGDKPSLDAGQEFELRKAP